MVAAAGRAPPIRDSLGGGGIHRQLMSVLLETHWGDVVIDVDLEKSPTASRNFLKLVKARQYTQCLVFRIDRRQHEGKVAIACTGCPRGNGRGGASVDAYLLADKALREARTSRHTKNNDSGHDDGDLEALVEKSSFRFLKSNGAGRNVRADQLVKGDVVALCIDGIPDTIGSQFGIVVQSTNASTGNAPNEDPLASSTSSAAAAPLYVLLGKVVEDASGVLDKLATTYCDDDNASASLGRPLVDIRVTRALVVDDPFDDPPGLANLMRRRGVVVLDDVEHNGAAGTAAVTSQGTDDSVGEARVASSPEPDKPPTEVVPGRVPVHEVEDEVDENKLREREELALRKEDKGRAIVLEMLGDLPDADIRAPENVLFICKLNPVTQDEDLELIFSRFDPSVKVDIIRDHETGASLQYAFAEFQTQQQAAEAYFKMNNALVDDRRIKVDFSQSVSAIWDKYRQRMRRSGAGGGGGGGGGNIGGGTSSNIGSSNIGSSSRAMPRLGPSFETHRDRREQGERRRGEPPGPHRGADERRRDEPRGQISQSRRYETHENRTTDRPTSHDRHHQQPHNDIRYDGSRTEAHRSSRAFMEARDSAGRNDDRDEFGRVKGWDSSNRGDGGDHRSERRGYSDNNNRGLPERTNSTRHADSNRPRRRDGSEQDHHGRFESKNEGCDRHDRDYDDVRNRRGPESTRERGTDKTRDNDNQKNRRRYDDRSPRDRDYSPPSNGRPVEREESRNHRRHDVDDSSRTRQGSSHRDSRATHSDSDSDSRDSRSHRKEKKEKRKHHKKRKRRSYSDDDDSDDESKSDRRHYRDNHKREEKRRTKKSKHRGDCDRSSDDDDHRSSKRRSAHRDHDRDQRRKRPTRSRSRS